jgi:Tol biopolymer transport system component/DNA-binding winged helix-turn-helix (wHTH) protein
MSQQNKHIYVFGPFRFDPRESLLLRDNRAVSLTPKVADTLHVLLQNAGNLVDKDELMSRVWPDAVVEEGNLNKNVFVLRKALGRFEGGREYIETVPKRGYRFVAPLQSQLPEHISVSPDSQTPRHKMPRLLLLGALCALLAFASFAIYRNWYGVSQHVQHTLTRVTFDDGLQIGATWSPDGRYLAYSSNRGGKFDIWVQQLSSGDPLQVTKGPGHHWQPNWSPDGRYIAYRSEGDSAGIYIIPSLGGVGLERKISSFGYYPRWSPDSTRVLIQPTSFPSFKSLYVVDIAEGYPHAVLADFFARHVNLSGRSAAWHPDGKRISICAEEPDSRFAIWTLPLSGVEGVQSKIDSAIFHQQEQSSFGFTTAVDFKFSWAPSGNAIYLERNFGSADNLWKLRVDPTSLQITSASRLTTGVGPDTTSSISYDGTKLAFTAETRHIQVWAAPFDPVLGRLSGSGESVTSPGVEAWSFSLSPDGENVVYSGRRGSDWGMWEKSLVTGREFPLGPNDAYRRAYPVWEADGSRIAYHRWKPPNGPTDLALWSRLDRTEQVVTNEDINLYGWSSHGSSVLVSRWNRQTSRSEIWYWPVTAKGIEKTGPKKITADPEYYLFQPQYSPDTQWIAFEAIRDGPNGRESSIFVMPSGGGSWIRVTDGGQWDDKPRWSPDGRTIYYVSGRDGINVWGRRFDAAKRRPVGDPFRVTDFSGSQLLQYDFIANIGLSIARRKLAVTVLQSSGSVWVLDNVQH